jgi:hypothetical protein
MKINKNSFRNFAKAGVLCLLILLLTAGSRRAAESFMDAVTDTARKEIVSALTDRTGDLPNGGPVRLAIGSFDDETGTFSEDAATMRQLLFGNLSLDRRFDPTGLNEFDIEYAKVAGTRPPDKLTQAELKDLGSRTWSSYLFFARIRDDAGHPFVQGYLLSLRRGVLVSTPRIPISNEIPKTERKPVIEESPDESTQKPAHETIETKPLSQENPLSPATGRIEYPAGEFQPGAVLDIAAAGSPLSLFVLTAKSLDVYSLNRDGVKQVWVGNFKKTYPTRGLSGRLMSGMESGSPVVVVSMNVFSKSFRYVWDGKQFRKDTSKLDGVVAEWQPSMHLALLSEYVPNGVLFAAKGSYMLDSSGVAQKKLQPAIADDYNAACVMRGPDGKTNPIRLVTVDASGRLHMVEPDGEKSHTEAIYGGDVNCWTSPSGIPYVVTTTAGGKNDSIVLLAYSRGKFEERWRSKPIEGSIYHHTLADINRDGTPEIIGVLELKNGTRRLFVAAPEYAGGSK